MTDSHSHRNNWIGAGLLALAIAYYFYSVLGVVTTSRTWVDEVTYLVKSLGYVTGAVSPYSDTDPTWYMPLYFYQLGFWQLLLDNSLLSGRLLSAVLGAVSGLLVFDIVRRLTGSWIASALGAASLLSVPAVVFYFGTATPIATVSMFVLLAVWICVINVSRPALWRSLSLGLIFGVLYFYRQNMILLIIAILPIYMLGMRQNRLHHSLAVLVGLVLVALPLLLIFPDRLFSYAIRLPVIAPLLYSLPFINDPLLVIHNNTIGEFGLGLAIEKIAFEDLLDAYALPYAGIILGACTVILLAPERLRMLWIAPLVFFFLSATHYLGSLGYCTTCALPYTASFAGIGAICVGISCSIIYFVSKNQLLPSPVIVGLFALTVFAYNETATGMATRDEYRYFPQAMLNEPRPIAEEEETRQLASFFRMNTNPFSSILPIHDLITVPYALFQAERSFPTQALNLRHSYRQLKPGLSDQERQVTRDALEKEGLWTDETLADWLSQSYDTIVFQADPRNRDSDLESIIQQSFNRTASTGFRGWNVHVYQRRTDSQESRSETSPQ